MPNRDEANPDHRAELRRAVAGPGLTAATRVVGVIGHPVGHSLSPLLHNTAFAHLGLDWVSVGFAVAPGDAAAALAGARALGVHGLSVTMPHKEDAAAAADDLAPEAARLGAVNCVVAVDGTWRGENTDGAGFVDALARGGRFTPSGTRCLVVGAGGAARAVIAALGDAGAAEVVVVNRTVERARTAAALAGAVGRVGSAEEATGCDLVVNATPAGMGDVDGGPSGWPVDPGLLGPGQVVVDLVYHPPVTPWLVAAAGRGAITTNGLGMLVHQAALQIGHWTGQSAPVDAMWDAVGGPEHHDAPR
ncbi:MAG TPA: shikimate dehydrogenase [Acidimicrobiales bacterium]